MPRIKNPERLYYEELFENLDIPFIRRNAENLTYFINPITGRQNEVTLVNLRRLAEQMVKAELISEELLYDTEYKDFEEKEGRGTEEIVQSKATYNNPTLTTVYNALKAHKGSMVRIVIYHDGLIIFDNTYRVPPIGMGGFWNEILTNELRIDSDTPLLPIKESNSDRYSLDVFTIQEVESGKPISQNFQQGIKHCILFPIKNWAKECYNNSSYTRGRRRYKKILEDVDNLMVKYKNGVPENELQAICELLQIDIKVDLPLNINDPFLFCKSSKKRLKLFEFINTRLNHVDLNELVCKDTIKNITRREMYDLKQSLDSENKYYIYNKDIKGISSITTFDGKYTINNEYLTIKNEFEIETKLSHCKIDDIDDSKLSAFVKCGTHYNTTIDFKDIYPFEEKIDSVCHIDMSKAYVNFHTCKWYEGFLGKITDYRKTNKIVTTGLYLVESFDFKANPVLQQYNDILRIYHSNNIYGSPELKMLSSFGVSYTIKAGCWGVSPIDFRFTEDMINKSDDEGNKYYAKWTGGSDQHNLEQTFYMRGDRELFQNISNYVSEGTIKWVGVNEGCISYKKESNYHLGHITSFITMYQRLNVIEQLMEMDITKIIRVCVDGVYYISHEFKLCNVFRKKTEKHFGNNPADRFISNIFENEIYDIIGDTFAEERDHFAKELHLGAGGTGKTHKALVDKGLVRALYVAPSRKLVRKKNEDYSITANVLTNLIINDVEKYDKVARFFNVLILDEVSMYSEKNKQVIFERFKNHKLIFCGDIGFQLPSWSNEPICIDGFDKIYNHIINYRIVCNELQKLCDLLRSLILNGIKNNTIDTDGYRSFINTKVVTFFTKKNRVIDMEELKELYTIKDYILVGTKKVGWEYTDMFKGTFEEEKYYIMSNTEDSSNGDVIFSKVKPEGNSEVRHHFTTHSIQGETIESNIFIDCSNMFDSRMFYTAISRAKRLDQIYITI